MTSLWSYRGYVSGEACLTSLGSEWSWFLSTYEAFRLESRGTNNLLFALTKDIARNLQFIYSLHLQFIMWNIDLLLHCCQPPQLTVLIYSYNLDHGSEKRCYKNRETMKDHLTKSINLPRRPAAGQVSQGDPHARPRVLQQTSFVMSPLILIWQVSPTFLVQHLPRRTSATVVNKTGQKLSWILLQRLYSWVPISRTGTGNENLFDIAGVKDIRT